LEHGSNPYNMAVLVEYANGDDDVLYVDLMESQPEDGEPTANALVVGLHLAASRRGGHRKFLL
jgi:hypothetical protein